MWHTKWWKPTWFNKLVGCATTQGMHETHMKLLYIPTGFPISITKRHAGDSFAFLESKHKQFSFDFPLIFQ